VQCAKAPYLRTYVLYEVVLNLYVDQFLRDFTQTDGFNIMTVVLEASDNGGTYYLSILEVLSKAAQSIAEWPSHETQGKTALSKVDFSLFERILFQENFQIIVPGLNFLRSWLKQLENAGLPLTEYQLGILSSLLPRVLELTGNSNFKILSLSKDCMQTLLRLLKIVEKDIVPSVSSQLTGD